MTSHHELVAHLTDIVGPDEPIVVLSVAAGASSIGVQAPLRSWIDG